MKHITIKRPYFHSPPEAQKRWLYAALVGVVVIAGLVAIGWYAGVTGFGEWSLFEE